MCRTHTVTQIYSKKCYSTKLGAKHKLPGDYSEDLLNITEL